MSPQEANRRARAVLAWARYRRMMWWMALVSIVTAVLAVVWLQWGGAPMKLHLVIATAAGVGFTVLLGTALMGLVFVSRDTGHDEAPTVDRSDRHP